MCVSLSYIGKVGEGGLVNKCEIFLVYLKKRLGMG